MMRMEPTRKWVFMVLWFIIISSDACWEDERIALMNLKPLFNSYDFHDWVEIKGSDCCEWERVECNSTTRRIISLSFNDTGNWQLIKDRIYLNISLFLPFLELKTLYLCFKGVAGFTEIHEGFGNLSSKLEILDLSGNFLNDSSLLFLSQLSSLKYLDLASNKFTGSSGTNGFKQLSRLNHLEMLDLSWNPLNNSILSDISSLPSLKTLKLENGNLEGTLDIQGLNNLINLKKLDLSFNKIESLQSFQDGGRQLKLTHLEELDLSYNLFTNSVFASLSGLSNLKSLYLRNNQLKGPLDMTDFYTFPNLEELDMSFNDLNEFANKGNKSLGKLKVLHLIHVITNGSLTTLQNTIEAFPSVKTFYLEWNDFNRTEATQGADQLNVSSLVEQLFLDGSRLNTNILQRMGGLASLKTLSLTNSELTGTLPDQGWCDLRNLEELDISENALEGKLPSCFGNLTSVHMLDISSNQFIGNLTPLSNLTSLRFLSLSKNRFQVPLQVVLLPNLKILLTNENKLIMEPVFYTSIQKLQLIVISLSNCTADRQLFEELTKFLYYQYDLRYIDLSYNNFSGTIPFWLLENNTKLEVLFLMGNSFMGPLLLPPLPNLNFTSLDISDNNIQGPIPTEICSTFPHLVWLFLSDNALDGDIPPCLGGMSDLSYLDLSNNLLSGRVPKELTMNNSLRNLKLSNNNLSGKMVSTIFKSSTLFGVYLDGNNFVGEMPDLGIWSVDHDLPFSYFDISNNNLSGKIPRWIWNLSFLEILDLSNNHFEGTIPMNVCNCGSIQFLDLSQNNLSGSIPACFNPPLLTHVHLSGNRLSGPLTHAFYNSSSLITLDLRGNNLTGNIPDWIGTLSALSVLLLKANHLDGGIPVQLCKCYSLSIIDLSQNLLSGHIPSCLGNLTCGFDQYGKSYMTNSFYHASIQEVSKYIGMELSNNEELKVSREYAASYKEEWVEFTTKSGLYSYKGNILQYMSGIDLSCNNLTGHIPLELGNLSELHSLNLSHNNLTGAIPASFSNLKQIESMDLSYNKLAGEIPKQLVDLNSLEVFNVAYNNLSGTTPEPNAQFGTFDDSSYEGNPLLCGPPLHNTCFKADLPPTVPTASDEGGGGLLDSYVFCVTFLVTYVFVLLVIFAVLYINPYWRQLWFLFIEDFVDTIVGNFVGLYIFNRYA